MKKRAVVLGAGPVGLVIAWKLLENGWSVEIHEKESAVGGMCKTWKWNDFLVDTGPHIFHTPDAQLAQFWEKEFGDLFVKGEFWCKNVKGERFDEYWDYPLSWEGISRYPQKLKENILKELDSLNGGKTTATNYTQYMEAQVGPTLRQMFFKKYPEKIWGISTDDMTPEWAPKRIEFRQKVTPFYYNQWNAVGKFGTGCVYDRIRDKILKLGGILHTGSTVTGISTSGKSVTGVDLAKGRSIVIGPQDVVVSSLPITFTARLLGYESSLKFRGIRSVYAAYRRPGIFPEGLHWLYYDSEHVFFNRITEQKKLSPFVAPPDRTFLTAEITYSKGDPIDTMDSSALMQKVAEQIERVGLGKRADLFDIDVHREDFVYPLQYRGYQEELARTRSALAQYEQLYSLGTGGDFNYADSQILFHKAFDTVAVLCGKESSYTQVIRRTPRCALSPSVNVGTRVVGVGAHSAYIIAEAGLNHNGSLKLAKQLVDAAKKSGCDAIKFQTFKAAGRISKKVKGIKYAEVLLGQEETLYDMFDRLAMKSEDQKELFEYARATGIEIFSTPFDLESVDFLESLNVRLYKIASMDLVNLPLIRRVARTGKPIILSTGMAVFGQVEEAVEVVVQEGNPNLMILHCNSSYPADPEEMNLNVIRTLKNYFKIPVGLSDHTVGLTVSHTALVLGADIIERHFTLDRTFEGPDHILSSEPPEMLELVSLARQIPKILGDGVKRIQPNEYATLNQQRKSLYAACPIKKGEVITADMVAVKGPGGGLLPKYLDMVIGRPARADIEEDYPITWDVI